MTRRLRKRNNALLVTNFNSIHGRLERGSLNYMDYKCFIDAEGDKNLSNSFFGESELLQELTRQFYLNDLFRGFDQASFKEITKIKDRIQAILRRIDEINESGDYRNWVEPRIAKKFSDRKLLQVAGIIHATGVLEVTERVRIYDLCGGSGILSTAIGLVRPPNTTSIVCIDKRTHGFHGTKTFKGMIKKAQIDFEFRRADIAEFNPEDVSDQQFWLGIHACGNATDVALANAHGQALITPCCYGTAMENSIKDINDDTWRKLCKMADWGSSLDKQRQRLGRIAMRVVDSLRAKNHGSLSAKVIELTPTKFNTRDHGIMLNLD